VLPNFFSRDGRMWNQKITVELIPRDKNEKGKILSDCTQLLVIKKRKRGKSHLNCCTGIEQRGGKDDVSLYKVDRT